MSGARREDAAPGTSASDARSGAEPGLPLEWAGASLFLLPDPGLWWPAGGTFFVADLHLGKEHVLQSAGLPVPAGTTDDDLERLFRRMEGLDARRLVVLGDLWHGRASYTRPVLDALRRWRDGMGERDVLLVRGNHDRWVGDPPEELGIRLVEGPWRMGPFVLRHEPTDEGEPQVDAAGVTGPDGAPAAMQASPPDGTSDRDGFELAGHVHPVVRLKGPGGDRLRVPCFRFARRHGLLPAFGGLTGGGEIRPRPGDRIFAVGEDEVMEVRTAADG